MIGRRRFATAMAAACLCWSAGPAAAQYSQPLFLEAARDPGRAEVAATARSLALGGAGPISGVADDAVANPASLVLGQGTDVVIAGGSVLFARDELAVTPRQLPPWNPTRATSLRSEIPRGYLALATRRPRWALAAFFDGTTRYRHKFETASAELAFATVQGVGFFRRGSGRASAAMSVERVGGAVAAAPWTGLVGVGVAAYAVRLDYRVSGNSEVETWTNTFTDLTFRYRFTTFELDRVQFFDWATGVVVSGVVKPVRNVALAGRWRHEPTFAARRELVARQPGSVERFEGDVQFGLPDTYALTGTLSVGSTVFATELARTDYGEVFGPHSQANVSPFCETLTTIHCPGWGFGSHRTADATAWRAGIEHSLSLRRPTLRLRAGIAVEQAYTLARSAIDPSRTGGSLPAPPVVSPFEPPRQSFRSLSFGAAYAWRRFEVGVGFAHAEHERHILADFRMSID